ncbi:MAG: preprotein translocase subunit SecE [Clostridia bacterium]|nr:preprotein translocase subunit SecE [Clostridia bacterium]
MAKKQAANQSELGLEQNKKALAKNKDAKKVQKEQKPKRNRAKETVSELKKVTWPTFGTVLKNTGMVLAVVLIFGLVIFGIDSLLSWIIKLIMNI